jgi:hypothetical protein
MSEARDIEEIVRDLDSELGQWANGKFVDPWVHRRINLLIADWRAKKAEIERLYGELDVLGASHKDLAKRMATTGRDAADSAYAKCEEIAEYEAAQGWSSARRIADAIAALRQRHADGASATDAG